jgi:hypothetical protein
MLAAINPVVLPALRIAATFFLLINFLGGTYIFLNRHRFFDRDPNVDNDIPLQIEDRGRYAPLAGSKRFSSFFLSISGASDKAAGPFAALIWLSPSRQPSYPSIGRGPLDRSAFVTLREREKNEDSLKLRRSNA